MRRAIKLLLIVMALGSAAVLSGCVVITGQVSQQLSTIGAVRLTTTICFSQQPGCPDNGNTGYAATHSGFQVMLGYRLPGNTSAPQSFNTTTGQFLSFNRDSSYAAELQRLLPAADGQKWVGYRTANLASAPSSPTFTTAPTFALRQADDGSPFSGPFAYRVVSGARVTPGNPNAPVDCGSNPAGNDSNKTSCVDSPAISEVSSNLQQPTLDLGIIDEQAVQRAHGGSASPLQFRIAYSGAHPAPTFALKASTDIPGASAKVAPSSVTPASANSRAAVKLHVPPSVPDGSYDVTLVASLANGQMRSSTHEIQVGDSASLCRSARPTVTGTSGDDALVGTRKRDVISAYGGDDLIRARGGNDLVCAGPGDDTAKGGPGDDTLAGRGGKDLLIGGHGHDLMIGGPGKDRFRH
jgi:hypothetical protein